MTARIDAPGTVCAFQSNGCTNAVLGRGGLDEHHAHPLSLGGAPNQSTMLALCPQHHRRQHSLIRYLVENAVTSPAVLGHFTHTEQQAAVDAVTAWRTAGSPPIANWPTPAAR